MGATAATAITGSCGTGVKAGPVQWQRGTTSIELLDCMPEKRPLGGSSSFGRRIRRPFRSEDGISWVTPGKWRDSLKLHRDQTRRFTEAGACPSAQPSQQECRNSTARADNAPSASPSAADEGSRLISRVPRADSGRYQWRTAGSPGDTVCEPSALIAPRQQPKTSESPSRTELAGAEPGSPGPRRAQPGRG